MMEMDWAMGAYEETGVVEMDRVMRGIYSEDPGVDSMNCIFYLMSYHLISSHLIIQPNPHSVVWIF
jgi:hypothetical protein